MAAKVTPLLVVVCVPIVNIIDIGVQYTGGVNSGMVLNDVE